MESSKALANTLADFVSSTSYGDIPSTVRRKAQSHLRDQLVGQIACARIPPVPAMREYVFMTGTKGRSSVLGADGRWDAELAALANGTAGHGFEIDDYHPDSLSHPSAIAAPAALAVAEDLACSGEEMLLAYILGMEVSCRIGMAGMPSMIFDRGFHGVSAIGPLGSSMTAGKLLELGPDKLAHALSIAASHCGGTTEYSVSGGTVKRVHAGMAAASGIRSARLASVGVSGPSSILEGSRGYFQAFSQEYTVEAVLKELGSTWAIADLTMKLYACCGLIHAPIDAACELFAAHNLSPDDVTEIRVGTNRLALKHVGSIGPDPKTVEEAQFSLEYSLALGLSGRGNSPSAYLKAAEEGFSDIKVSDMAHRIILEVDDRAETEFPAAFFSRITCSTNSRDSFRGSAYARGTPARPILAAEAEAKARNLLLGSGFAAGQADLILTRLDNLEHAKTTEALVSALNG